VAEKAESNTGWLFPVGDEANALGYSHMFVDQLDALDKGTQPMETFYDGYVVNAIMDACYKSVETKKWEPVELAIWRGADDTSDGRVFTDFNDEFYLIKAEKMPDGMTKTILKNKKTGEVIQQVRKTQE